MTWSFHPYHLPLARPYAWAKGVQASRSGVLVAFHAGGVTGWGEVAPPPQARVDPEGVAAFARKAFRVALAQEDVPAALDAAGCGPRLRCGLVGAWLDAGARQAAKPLADFVADRLGFDAPTLRRIPVNALVPAVEPEACAREAQALVASGFTCLKLKSDGRPDTDVARVRAVRAAVGPDVALRLDANESYPAATAVRALEALAPFGLEYVEQPTPANDRAALVRLLSESPVPVALDESVTSWTAIAPLAHLRPTLILKPQRLGGIDRTAQIITKATRTGLRCVVTNSLETAVGRAHAAHAAALLPAPAPACGLATEGFLATDVAAFRAEAGFLELPAGPGLGLAPDLEALRALPLA
jgi:o-succinylbenzoate synthase